VRTFFWTWCSLQIYRHTQISVSVLAWKVMTRCCCWAL